MSIVRCIKLKNFEQRYQQFFANVIVYLHKKYEKQKILDY